MTIGGFFALGSAAATVRQLESGELVDLLIVGTGVIALFVGLFLTARASRARRALAAEAALLARATLAPAPPPAAPPPAARETPAPEVSPDVPHAVRPELEVVRAFAKILAAQRLSAERDRRAFMHHALMAAADALTERLDPSQIPRISAPSHPEKPAEAATSIATSPPVVASPVAPAGRSSAPRMASASPTLSSLVPATPFVAPSSPASAPRMVSASPTLSPHVPPASPTLSSPVPSARGAVSSPPPLASPSHAPTPVPAAPPPELTPTPLRPPPLDFAAPSRSPSASLAVTTPPPAASSPPVHAPPLIPQLTFSVGTSAPAPSAPLEMGDPFSVSRAEPPPPAPRSQPPSSRRSRLPPPGGRLTGDDLLSDLFDLMHGLSFFESALEGAEFVLASALEEIPCRIALCHFYDSTKREFVLVRGVGAGHEQLLFRRTPAREPLIEAALVSRRPAILKLRDGDARLVGTRWAELERPPSALAVVPVMSGARFLALVELADPTHDGAFADGDDHALAYVAEQFAIFLGEKGLVLDDKALRGSVIRPAASERKRATR